MKKLYDNVKMFCSWMCNFKEVWGQAGQVSAHPIDFVSVDANLSHRAVFCRRRQLLLRPSHAEIADRLTVYQGVAGKHSGAFSI